MSAQNINENTFQNAITTGTALIDFYADRCPSCRAIAPIIDQISEECPDITVGKINVDIEEDLASRFAIKSIPTIIIFKDGKEISRIIGAKPKAVILDKLV